MRLTYFEIKNIKGVSHLKFEPGTITRITGANGTGKSSVIDAVTAVFTGGSDPGWLRAGCEQGFIRLQVSDDRGRLAATITKTISRKADGAIKTELEVVDPNGVPIPAPQTFINGLGESWAVDPATILSMDTSTAAGRKALMSRLLEIMPIEFSTADFIGAGAPDAAVPKKSTATLQDLAKTRKYVEDMRRKVGVEAEQAMGSVQSLRRSLPEEPENEDWGAKEAGARRALAVLMQNEADEVEAARAAIRAKYAAESERIAQELATARERAGQQQKAAGMRDLLGKFEVTVRTKNCERDELTRTLEGLDKLKKQKLEELPVDGLGFDGECVTVDGIPWHHVNTGRRAVIAAQISSMRAGELPFLVQDNAEHLDEETRAAYEQALIEAGFQVLEAVISNGTLTVENVL